MAQDREETLQQPNVEPSLAGSGSGSSQCEDWLETDLTRALGEALMEKRVMEQEVDEAKGGLEEMKTEARTGMQEPIHALGGAESRIDNVEGERKVQLKPRGMTRRAGEDEDSRREHGPARAHVAGERPPKTQQAEPKGRPMVGSQTTVHEEGRANEKGNYKAGREWRDEWSDEKMKEGERSMGGRTQEREETAAAPKPPASSGSAGQERYKHKGCCACGGVTGSRACSRPDCKHPCCINCLKYVEGLEHRICPCCRKQMKRSTTKHHLT